MKTKYYIALLIYALLSVASQYGSGMLIPLEFIMAGLFLPISCFTIIPLLDCARSFTQHEGEQANVVQKSIYQDLLGIPFVISLAACAFAGLPLTIFIGAIVATNVGGWVDISIFKFMRRFSEVPTKRMAVSNFCATVIGSMAFYLIAFTQLVPTVLGMAGYEFVNVLAQPSVTGVMLSALLQAAVIWCCAIPFSIVISWVKSNF